MAIKLLTVYFCTPGTVVSDVVDNMATGFADVFVQSYL